MATDIERLVVQLSADFKSFEKSLARQQGISNRQFSAIERRARQMNKNLDSIFSRSFSGLTAPLAGIGAALGVDQLRKMTDTWTDMTSRVNLAAGSMEKGTEVMGRLGEMARRTYSDLTQTAESYLSNATALKELGFNTDQSLDYTEALNNALVVSGAKGDRAARVIDALAKAMALGKLSGDNLNTVIEVGGRAAEALAKGLGTTVGGLRRLGAQGKITGNDIVRGLSSQMEVLRKEAEAMPATIGDGFTLLNNALLEYVGNADSATGVSAKVSEALVMIADNFDKVADAGLQFAAVIAGALVGRSLAGMIRTLSLAGTALARFTQALAAARTMGGLATALGALGAAAGPVGLIIGGAVVSSLILYNSTIGKSSEASEVYAAALKKVQDAAQKTGDAVEETSVKIERGLPQKIEGGIAYSLEEIAQAAQVVNDQFDNLRNVSFEGVPQEEVDKVQELGRQFKAGKITADELAAALDGIARANPAWESFTKSVEGFIGKLREAIVSSRELKAELADINSSNGRSAKDDVIKVDLNAIAAGTYEKEALRRAALGKSQLSLENEIAKVRNDALKEGITLTEKQIETIAKANIAGDAARSAEGKKPKKEKKTPEDKFDTTVKDANDRTAALVAETEALRGINPLIDDYGYAMEKARTEQELLNAATKAGVAITPELRAQISQTAEQWALASAEANKLAEAQDKIRQRAEEWRDAGQDATRGFVDDLMNGVSAAEALANALDKVLDKLLDMAFDDIFTSIFKGSGGGLLSFLGLGKKDGGIVKAATGGYIRGAGGPRSDSIPAMLSNGEYVVNAAATKKFGPLLDRINSGHALALAGGGMANLRAPTMPVLSPQRQSSGGGSMRVDVGVSVDNNGNLQAFVRDVSRQESASTVKAYDKSGPMRFARDSKQATRRGLVR